MSYRIIKHPIYEYFNGSKWVEVVMQRSNDGIRVRYIDLEVDENNNSKNFIEASK